MLDFEAGAIDLHEASGAFFTCREDRLIWA